MKTTKTLIRWFVCFSLWAWLVFLIMFGSEMTMKQLELRKQTLLYGAHEVLHFRHSSPYKSMREASRCWNKKIRRQ